MITLNTNTESVQYLCNIDKRLAKVISMVGTIEYSVSKDPYVFMVHEIIEQMLSVKAGQKIFGRLVDLCDREITPQKIDLLSVDDIHNIGTSINKVHCIKNITSAILSQDLVLSDLYDCSNDEAIQELTKYKGIGNWTAKMFLIFVLDREDVLPYEDGAFLQSFRWMYKTQTSTPEAVKKKCKKWKPYSIVSIVFRKIKT